MSEEKNPHAVLLGRLGGLKSAKARMEKIPPEKRKEIAKRANQKRNTVIYKEVYLLNQKEQS